MLFHHSPSSLTRSGFQSSSQRLNEAHWKVCLSCYLLLNKDSSSLYSSSIHIHYLSRSLESTMLFYFVFLCFCLQTTLAFHHCLHSHLFILLYNLFPCSGTFSPSSRLFILIIICGFIFIAQPFTWCYPQSHFSQVRFNLFPNFLFNFPPHLGELCL